MSVECLTGESRKRRNRRRRSRPPVDPEQCGLRIDPFFPKPRRSRKGPKARPLNPVYLVDSPERLALLSRHLRKSGVLGVDIESAWRDGANVTCLLQIADQERNWLIDPTWTLGLGPLKPVMEDSAIVKVIHDAIFEKRMLLAFGIKIYNIFDTLVESRRTRGSWAEGGHSLKAVCHRELFISIDKTEQRSDWSMRPLSHSQHIYAAMDAEVLVRIHSILKDLPDAPPPPPPPEPVVPDIPEADESLPGTGGPCDGTHPDCPVPPSIGESGSLGAMNDGACAAEATAASDATAAGKPRRRRRNYRRKPAEDPKGQTLDSKLPVG